MLVLGAAIAAWAAPRRLLTAGDILAAYRALGTARRVARVGKAAPCRCTASPKTAVGVGRVAAGTVAADRILTLVEAEAAVHAIVPHARCPHALDAAQLGAAAAGRGIAAADDVVGIIATA